MAKLRKKTTSNEGNTNKNNNNIALRSKTVFKKLSERKTTHDKKTGENKHKVSNSNSENSAIIVRKSLRIKSKEDKNAENSPGKSMAKEKKINSKETQETKPNNNKVKCCEIKLRQIKPTLSSNTNADRETSGLNLSFHEREKHAKVTSGRKFFISRKPNENLEISSSIKSIKPPENAPNKNNEGEQSNNEDIYDFPLSQTSQSNDQDPNKEIIEKLVKEGKASIIKHSNKIVKTKKKRTAKKGKKISSKKVLNKEKISHKPETIKIDEENIPNKMVRFKSQLKEKNKQQTQSNEIENKIASPPLKESSKNEQNKSQIQKPKLNKGLLEMVKKIVESTPIGKNKLLQTRNSPNMSPITISGNKSPWRLPERIGFLQTSRISLNNDISFPRLNNNTPGNENTSVANISNRNQKSFEFKSDAENINPQSGKLENENSFFKEKNPKVYRSPLKQIKILDVVKLPPLSTLNTKQESKIKEKPHFQSSLIQNISSVNINSTRNENITNSKDEIDSLFGFEEYLTTDESSNQSGQNYSNNFPSKRDLIRKLKRFRYALPKNLTEKKLTELKHFSKKHNNNFGWEKQTNIPELLSSIKDKNMEKNKPKAFGNNVRNFPHSNDNESQNIDLFDEPVQGETTLNFSAKRRTYSKNLRERKQKKNFIIPSDPESHDEMEDDERVHKNTKKKKERRRKETKRDEELESFAAEFNSMCEEVDNFEMLIE